jgi:hypothetical protein
MKVFTYIGMVLFVASVIFQACTPSSSESSVEIIPLMDRPKASIPLSSIAQIDSLWPLESNGFQDFGEIQHLVMVPQGILIHSQTPTTLSLVNTQGKIIRQLTPDHRLTDIREVQVIGEFIYLLHKAGRQIQRLDFQFDLLQKIDLPVPTQSFQVFDANTLALYSGNDRTSPLGKVVLYRWKDEQILFHSLPTLPNLSHYFHFLTTGHFPYSGETMLFWDSALNTLYQVQGDGLVPFRTMDYGTHGLPDEFYETERFSNVADFLLNMRKTNYAFRHFMLKANQDYLYTHFEKGGEFLTLLHHLPSGQSITFTDLMDDMVTGASLDELKISFIVALHGETSFVAFLPMEALADYPSPSQNASLPTGSNLLLFGKFTLAP